jgi:hypothetical protein
MTDDGALFGAEEVAALPHRAGAVEAGLAAAAEAAWAAGTLVAEDRGMLGAAMVAARKLDAADRMADKAGGYLVAQLLTPYRETLQALRLPAALSPVTAPPPAGSQTDTPDWFSDAFGTPE